MAREEHAIDQVIATLFANDAQGYHGVAAKVLKGEAMRVIQKNLSTLDKKKRSDLEDETNYRLKRFDDFHKMTPEKRDEVLRIAKERALTIEEAYELTGNARN